MAKKTIRRVKYPLEDNVKRVLFLRPGDSRTLESDFVIPYATRAETDEGVLTNKALNPDVGAYAYDRLRYIGRHEAGKGTKTVALSIEAGIVRVDGYRSNVFRLNATESFVLQIVNPMPGQVIKLRFKQDATGGRQATWPANFKWVNGEEPQLTLTPNAVDVVYTGYDEEDGLWEGNLLPDCR